MSVLNVRTALTKPKTKGYRPKKELSMRQKIIGSALCLLLYRLLSFVPLPFVDSAYIKSIIGANGSLGLLNMLSGGSLGNMSLMALGIGPWITASIVLQLLGMAFPSIAELNKEPDGKRKYKLITFAMSAAFALAEAVGLMMGYGRQGTLSEYTWYTVLAPALLMMAGTGILSLMAWCIDEKLFGNGTSLILTTGIVCSYVSDGTTLGVVLAYGKSIPVGIVLCIIAILVLLGLFTYTVFISSCEKRLHVTYSRKLSGSSKDGSTIPLKMVTGGVVPVIFASTVITAPALIGTMFRSDAEWLKIFNTSWWLNGSCPWASIGFVLYLALIIAFGYFCQSMYLNPVELSKSLQKKGGTVPGIRPGKPTVDYILSQARWLTALGGISLCIVAAIPIAVSGVLRISSLSFLGTSVLITVSTIDEAWKEWTVWKKSQSLIVKGTVVKGIL